MRYVGNYALNCLNTRPTWRDRLCWYGGAILVGAIIGPLFIRAI